VPRQQSTKVRADDEKSDALQMSDDKKPEDKSEEPRKREREEEGRHGRDTAQGFDKETWEAENRRPICDGRGCSNGLPPRTSKI
jgi:hypothetical protein